MAEALTLEQLDESLRAFEERFDKKLANFATKKDLESFATKADLKNFATEIEKKIDEKVEELARMSNNQFIEITKDIEEVKAKSDRIDTRLLGIELRLDNMAPKFEVEELKKKTGKIEMKLGIVAATV